MHRLFLAAMRQEAWGCGDYLGTLPCEHSTDLPVEFLPAYPAHSVSVRAPRLARPWKTFSTPKCCAVGPREPSYIWNFQCPESLSHATQPHQAHPKSRAVPAGALPVPGSAELLCQALRGCCRATATCPSTGCSSGALTPRAPEACPPSVPVPFLPLRMPWSQPGHRSWSTLEPYSTFNRKSCWGVKGSSQKTACLLKMQHLLSVNN